MLICLKDKSCLTSFQRLGFPIRYAWIRNTNWLIWDGQCALHIKENWHTDHRNYMKRQQSSICRWDYCQDLNHARPNMNIWCMRNTEHLAIFKVLTESSLWISVKPSFRYTYNRKQPDSHPLQRHESNLYATESGKCGRTYEVCT